MRQRSARREITKKKSGTLPLFIYRTDLLINHDVEDIPDGDDNEPADGILEYATDGELVDSEEREKTDLDPTDGNQSEDLEDSSESESDEDLPDTTA